MRCMRQELDGSCVRWIDSEVLRGDTRACFVWEACIAGRFDGLTTYDAGYKQPASCPVSLAVSKRLPACLDSKYVFSFSLAQMQHE